MFYGWIKMLFAVVLNLQELLGREAKHWPITINRSILLHRNSKLFCSILHTVKTNTQAFACFHDSHVAFWCLWHNIAMIDRPLPNSLLLSR